jgi:hypothetical protein
MTWGVPSFLWASLVLIPLAAVYFIKTRPRRQLVSAFFLWEQVLDQKTARSLFQRLRNLLSLLLLALAFLGAVFSLACPSFGERDERDLLIVIDRSASMAGGGETSWMELARDRADDWISGLAGNQRAALATIDSELHYLVHLTDQAKPLKRALEKVEASELPLDPEVLKELSLLATDEDTPVRVLWLTDGRSEDVELPAGIERVEVGDKGENFAITAADLSWQSQNEVRLFVSISSTSEEEREVELELVQPETSELVRFFTVVVPAGGEVSDSLTIENLQPGPWELRLLGDDDLMVDNVVPLGLNLPKAISVQVVSETPYFFEQVVQAFANADSLFQLAENGAQMTLPQGVVPDSEVAMIFAPQGDSPFWSELGDELSPAVPETLVEDHPLLEQLDPGLLRFEGARTLKAPEGAVVVLAHPDGVPLLYSLRREGTRAVVVNLDPARADFFLSPWFPVLVHDATVLLTGREGRLPSVVATGVEVELPGTGEVTQVTRRFQGEEASLEAASPVTVKQRGVFETVRENERAYFGAGLLSPGESGAPISREGSEVVVEPGRGWPLAIWLLLIAVVVIVLEEGLYQRRKVG